MDEKKLVPTKSMDLLIKELDSADKNQAKKLVRKIYTIVLVMITLLIAIIIIEFKEYSFYTPVEYKIGKNDLGPRDLVWAGIMGTPPSYYESDTKYGFGIKEYETREIRVALEEAGINIIYRYMSPNRLEFEFARKHPLCFYDRKWSNPKEYFKNPRPEILSLALNYSGRELKKIIFRKEDRHRFEKHLDEKGNIILNSLINDTSLKTELIRAVNYDGPFARKNITYGKKQLDGTYYDNIKDKYAKNVDLIILHTNDQILQMLAKKRFDYQFYNTLEYDDYVWIQGGKKRIDTIIYDDNSVTSFEDPNLIFHSVACGNHPLTKHAMPIINEVIKKNRIHIDNHNRFVKYAKKLNPLTNLEIYSFTLTAALLSQSKENLGDKWYEKQFTLFNKSPWPVFFNKDKNLKEGTSLDLMDFQKGKSTPQWNLIEKLAPNGEKTLIIIHDTDLKNKLEEILLTKDFLEKPTLGEIRKNIDKKEKFAELDFSKIEPIQNLVIFARGIKDNELILLEKLYSSSRLKGLTLIEGSLSHSKEIQKNLSTNVEVLRFCDVPMFNLPIGQTLKKLPNLKSFALHWSDTNSLNRMDTTNLQLLDIIKSLPATLKELSLSENPYKVLFASWFPEEFSDVFASKKFNNLNFLHVKNFPLSERSLKLILDNTPIDLESLIIGSSTILGSISSLLIEEFLNKRYSINKLKTLKINRMILSLKKNNKITLPKSLEDLSITWTEGSMDSNFDRIIFHPELRLKSLDLSQNNLSDNSVKKILPFLSDTVQKLVLSKNNITGKIFLNSKQREYNYLQTTMKIKILKLDSNPIDDYGFAYFSKLPWNVNVIDFSNTKITDNALNIFSNKKMPDLKEIDLSDNHLSHKYISTFLKNHAKNLISIKLRNVLSLDTKIMAKYISKNLDVLDISSNLLSDDQIMNLASYLPKNLRVLNIIGSRMGEKGAIELAKFMPNLTEFFFDFKAGFENIGLKYLFSNLSPYLTKISTFNEPLSFKNATLLVENMPKFLIEFNIPEFESEECKILFSHLHFSLRSLILLNEIKSKGNSLKLISENYPSQLINVNLGSNAGVDVLERDSFLEHNVNKLIFFYNSGSEAYLSPISLKYLSRFLLIIFGNKNFQSKYFENIILTPLVQLQNITQDKEIGDFLIQSKPSQLKFLYFLTLDNIQIEKRALIDFIKKLPSTIQGLTLRNVGIKLEDVGKILEVMPKNLRRLNISQNPLGEVGMKKFREFKKKMETSTGLPFDLVEEMVYN